jgi:hypothetical protein
MNEITVAIGTVSIPCLLNVLALAAEDFSNKQIKLSSAQIAEFGGPIE